MKHINILYSHHLKYVVSKNQPPPNPYFNHTYISTYRGTFFHNINIKTLNMIDCFHVGVVIVGCGSDQQYVTPQSDSRVSPVSTTNFPQSVQNILEPLSFLFQFMLQCNGILEDYIDVRVTEIQIG